MGYEGDPVYDQHLANPNAPKRPWWTKNGSLMAFRNLEQDVFGFEAFLNERAPYWKEHTPVSTEVQPPFKNDQEKADFIGATIVGRWKSVRTPKPYLFHSTQMKSTFFREPQSLSHISETIQ